jgi:LysM repeat protein
LKYLFIHRAHQTPGKAATPATGTISAIRILVSKAVVLLLLFICQAGIAQNNFVPDTAYKWLHPELAMLQFYQRKAVLPLYNAWKSAGSNKCVIVYKGDSHVQPDILPGELRRVLQSVLGQGGRGFVFPYSTANTYSSVEYKSTHKGTWTYGKGYILPPKVTLGVAGMASRTADSAAGFTLEFDDPLPENYTVLHIYCKKQPSSYDFDLFCDTTHQRVIVDSFLSNAQPYIEVHIPPVRQSITIKLHRSNACQNEFEFYGMDIMSRNNTGVVVHSVGVGATRFQAVLYEELLPEQLKSLDPALVILDYGTNDYLYDDRIKPDLEGEIIKSINIVRTAVPNSAILLTSTHDMYRRGRNLRSGIAFSDLVRRIAKNNDCLFFDWFWIAGGQTTMKLWEQHNLAQPDMIHLSYKGSKLKGDLLADAFIRTMKWVDANPDADSLVLILDSTQKLQKQMFSKDTIIQLSQSNAHSIKHRIKSGETLGSIARKYGVSVTQIKKWNDLASNIIIAGDILIIYKKGYKSVPEIRVQQVQPKPNPKPANNNAGTTQKSGGRKGSYTVKSGDTLWDIAKKYNTTVDAIKKANKIKGNDLKPGQVLIIP